MSDLTLTFLGIPGVERDGRPVALARHKALALRAYLAVTGAPHRRDALDRERRAVFFFRHSGASAAARRAKAGEPGIHNPGCGVWIPGPPLRGVPE